MENETAEDKRQPRDPERGARAKQQIDRIVTAATRLMLSMKTAARTKVPWTWNASAAIFFAVVVCWLFYALFRRGR